jgi:arylsulfatase A-like enzyme
MIVPHFDHARLLEKKTIFAALIALGTVTRVVACGSDLGQSTIREPGGSLHPSPTVPDGAAPVRSSGSEGVEAGPEEGDASMSIVPTARSDGAPSSPVAVSNGDDAVEPKRLSDSARSRLPMPLSFLLITVDTLRPDLGYMGYERPVSPHIDRLAEHSVVYERAYSISTYTGFALTPMMASRYVSEMPRTDRHEVKYLKQNVLLAERLLSAGYHTAGAASHFLFAPELGWIDGFERFAKVPAEGKAPPGSSIDWFHTSRGMADVAIRMLSDPGIVSGPFFIWLHFLDPHKQYLEHPGFSNFGRDRRGLYDGEIAYTDFHIGRVLDALDASPLRARTAVILTADHGEAFGEHGFSYHGRQVWDEVVRVPLIVFVPGASPRRISRRISAVEFAPTILDLAGLPEDKGARGQSFAPELFGADQPERPILIDQPKNPYYPLTRAFIDKGYKLHYASESNTYRLFDLTHDPGERNDLAPTNPELLARMRKAYDSFMAGITEVTPRSIAPAAPKGAGQ